MKKLLRGSTPEDNPWAVCGAGMLVFCMRVRKETQGFPCHPCPPPLGDDKILHPTSFLIQIKVGGVLCR